MVIIIVDLNDLECYIQQVKYWLLAAGGVINDFQKKSLDPTPREMRTAEMAKKVEQEAEQMVFLAHIDRTVATTLTSDRLQKSYVNQ